MNYCWHCWQQLQERNGCATFKRENGRESALTAVVALRHQLQHNSVVNPQLYCVVDCLPECNTTPPLLHCAAQFFSQKAKWSLLPWETKMNCSVLQNVREVCKGECLASWGASTCYISRLSQCPPLGQDRQSSEDLLLFGFWPFLTDNSSNHH